MRPIKAFSPCRKELQEAYHMDQHIPILVVSSEFKNRFALRDILSREGWETICTSTVSECEELFDSQNIAIVFCERDLTDGTYRDILTMTRSRRRSVRLVVTSRLADWGEYLEALRDGAFDLIASPSQRVDVVRVIDQAQREDQIAGAPVPAGEARAASGGVLA